MFKNKKIVLFLLVLPLVAVLVAPKVALADDDSDWVKNIPIIGGVVDFASDPGGWITDRFAEGAEFFFNDGLQNIKTTSTKSILGKSFNNLLGKKTGTFYSTVSFVNKSVVMPTAASVSVSEKGKNGKIVVKDISVAVNDEVKICTLPKGKYLLTVESAPDGYDKPAKSTSFTVKGDGKKVSAFAFLAKHVDKTAKSGESEDNAEATPADGASQNQDASSDGQNQNNQAENSSADMNRGTSAPSSGNGQPSSTSTPTTTKTIHHPAETIRIAICDTCGADITDDIEGHKKSTGHPWYHYDAKVVKEAWDETVTVN